MTEYHKIQTVYLRDPATKHRTLLAGQYAKPIFEYLAGCTWQFTEKVDGTNIRIVWDGERAVFGGRTDRAQIHAGLVEHLRETFPAQKLAEVFDGPAVLYGEGCGAKIQKGGGNYYPDQRFVLFDVLCGGYWLQRDDVDDVATKLGVPSAPVIGEGTLSRMVDLVRNDAMVSTWGDFRAEGIVARPAVECFDRRGDRVITKIKCKDFGRG